MPRLISFAMTTDQVREKTKTVTRRWAWLHAKPGMILTGVEKAMGLKKGEKIVRLCDIRVISVRRERLDAMVTDMDYGRKELQLEGHPFGLTCPAEFVAKLCKGTKNKPSDLITRIEYEYI